jgi:membrane peptidoglycan carboxypeptidase
MYHKQQSILKIQDRDGNVLWEYKPGEGTRVLDERSTYLMTDILYNYKDTMKRINGYNMSGKTGTSDSNKDMWFMGFSPEFAVGVWVGNNNNTNTTREFGSGGLAYGFNAANPLWARYVKRIVDRYPNTAFTRPAGISKLDICTLSGRPLSEECKKAGYVGSDLFIDGKIPAPDDSITFATLCVDPNDKSKTLPMLARQIDIDYGYAREDKVVYVKMLKSSQQAQFDRLAGQTTSGLPNLPVCNTDYSALSISPGIQVNQPGNGYVLSNYPRTLLISLLHQHSDQYYHLRYTWIIYCLGQLTM